MSMMSKDILKPLAVAGWVFLIDDYYSFGGSMDGYSMKNSSYFAVSAGVAVAVAQMAAPSVAASATGVESSPFSNGKNMEVRLLELGLGGIGSHLVNTQVVNKGANDQTWDKRFGIFLVGDVLGEITSDYLLGNPMW